MLIKKIIKKLFQEEMRDEDFDERRFHQRGGL